MPRYLHETRALTGYVTPGTDDVADERTASHCEHLRRGEESDQTATFSTIVATRRMAVVEAESIEQPPRVLPARGLLSVANPSSVHKAADISSSSASYQSTDFLPKPFQKKGRSIKPLPRAILSKDSGSAGTGEPKRSHSIHASPRLPIPSIALIPQPEQASILVQQSIPSLHLAAILQG